ncbi:hypothetical protein Q5752_006429 [Cryptotrichosporon argae]
MAKRKHTEVEASAVVHRPPAGHQSYKTGAAVRDGLATGTRQAIVSLQQQILTLTSSLPLPISHATIVILQHYLEVSPTVEEVFAAWRKADEVRDDKLAESAVGLLASILRILTPVPFFHSQLVDIVNKLLNPVEPYHDLLNRLIASGRRENVFAGMSLASAATNVDPPDPATNLCGRLAVRLWTLLADGGSAKAFGKLLGMRRRTKEGNADYGGKDPLDRPDVRHLALGVVLPLLSTQGFHTYAKGIMSAVYSGLASDPPITISRVLTALWQATHLPSPGIARRISLVLFDESALDHLLKLLPRIDEHDGRKVGDTVASFLYSVTADPSRGICFPDQGWYPRTDGDKRGVHNRILGNVVNKLGGRAVDDARIGEWVVKVFAACPELVAGYWPHSALNIEPRLSARWIASMAHVGRIVSLPPPSRSTFNIPAKGGSVEGTLRAPPAVATVIESILPSPLTKAHIMKGLQHTDGLVQHLTALSLARCLQKLSICQALIREIEDDLAGEPGSSDNPWSTFQRELELEARRRVPEVPVIVEFAQKAAQSAPAEVDTAEERAQQSRLVMLTEVALRLFGFYHKTLPSLANEARFDVGKLLVSASSANAERKARREAREGSVISDTGSVGSIGTLGTVGMGGGFGHARGDVVGFEALSQLHVVRLLADVKEWNWTNKAAGSQYSYLYHVLQLHLSTLNPITQVMTSTLLHRLLSTSLLFEHDPAELSLWLDALPRASETISGPMLVAQQIHLLSFFDECARRAIKTAHRYIEETQAVHATTAAEATSPLVVVMVEQLGAKIAGMHIATEAAAVVLSYLRRVLVSLIGKHRNMGFEHKIVAKLEGIVIAARDAGQPRAGLLEIVQAVEADLAFEPAPSADGLVEEADYKQRSFERRLLDALPVKSAEPFEAGITPASALHHAQFVLHIIERKADRALLDLLLICLNTSDSDKLKVLVFENETLKTLLLSSEFPEPLDAIARKLSTTSHDRALAEPYTAHLLLAHAGPVARFARFFSASQLSTALGQAIASSDVDALNTLVGSAAQVQALASHIDRLVSLGVIAPLVSAIKASSPSEPTRFTCKKKTLQKLADGDERSCELLALLTPDNLEVVAALMAKTDLAPRHLAVLDLLPLDPAYAPIAAAALQDPILSYPTHNAAISVLSGLNNSHPDAVINALDAVTLKTFSPPLARAAAVVPTQHVVDVGLQYVTRMCSSTRTLTGDELEIMTLLSKATEHVELDLASAESAVIAVIQDRLDVDLAVDMAAAIVKRAMLKAGFVRQNLQSLLDSAPLARRKATVPQVRFLAALFHSSTYTSCQPNFLEPILSLYTGTLSPSDKLILSLLQTFERVRKISAASVLRTWSATGGTSSCALDALNSLDAGKVWATCLNYPLRRSFDKGEDNAELYDPVFCLSLLAAALHEDITGLDWVEIMRGNILGLAVCALASRDAVVRAFAGSLLAKTLARIQEAAFLEQAQLVQTFELVQHAIPEGASQPRLPTITTLFVASALRSQASPAHFLYPLSSRFLLQRPTFDPFDVPLLYTSLYSSSDAFKRERSWIVRLIRDGTRSTADWRILKRRNTWALLSSIYQASVDATFRRLVLHAIETISRVPEAARWLLNKGGVVAWLAGAWDGAKAGERDVLLRILDTLAIGSEPRRDLAAFVCKVAGGQVDMATLARIAVRQKSRSLLERIVEVLPGDAPSDVLELLFALSLDTGASRTTLDTLGERIVRHGGELAGSPSPQVTHGNPLPTPPALVDPRPPSVSCCALNWPPPGPLAQHDPLYPASPCSSDHTPLPAG